jgi:hypothetical protein
MEFLQREVGKYLIRRRSFLLQIFFPFYALLPIQLQVSLEADVDGTAYVCL